MSTPRSILLLSAGLLPACNGGEDTGTAAGTTTTVTSSYATSTTTTGSPPPTGGVVYVRADATGAGDGASWQDAMISLTDALAQAASGGEIWVAAGTYTPGSDRWDTFALHDGLTLLGGFAGTETASDQRDWAANPTILSGEIGDAGSLEDNSYHVVTGATSAVIDGFVISDGYAQPGAGEEMVGAAEDILEIEAGMEDEELLRVLDGYMSVAGAGMINIQAAPTVRNTTFEGNTASKGGAVYNMVATTFPARPENAGEAATFENVTFSGNEAFARGGAINNDFSTSPSFFDVTFEGNTTSSKGGALYNDAGCNPVLVNALFVGNSAERGAAVVGDGSSFPVLVYTTIVGNNAGDIGAGLYMGTYMGDPNTAHLRRSIVVANTSGASSSSISLWHDDGIDADADSIIEEIDGELSAGDVLVDLAGGDYSAVDATLGWAPGRDWSDWESLVTDLQPVEVDAFPYDTAPQTGAGGRVFHVSLGGAGDGLSWASALGSLTDALDVAQSGDAIWISEGTYRPTDDTTDRAAAFVLREGVSVFGGFCGDESSSEDRGISTGLDGRLSFTCQTTLSGDIDQDTDTAAGANSYHVVVGARGASLNGLVIEGGAADGDHFHGRGGGLLAYEDRSGSVGEKGAL